MPTRRTGTGPVAGGSQLDAQMIGEPLDSGRQVRAIHRNLDPSWHSGLQRGQLGDPRRGLLRARGGPAGQILVSSANQRSTRRCK
jgi:hypothetical protein